MSQSLPTSLLSDVTAISSETKKKNPELREVTYSQPARSFREIEGNEKSNKRENRYWKS